MKPRLEMIHRGQHIYVRETVRTYQGEDAQRMRLSKKSKPLDHGPMRDAEEASAFIKARTQWWFGLHQHIATFGADVPYRDFEFDGVEAE
jgi:hypothetical protein